MNFDEVLTSHLYGASEYRNIHIDWGRVLKFWGLVICGADSLYTTVNDPLCALARMTDTLTKGLVR